MHHHKYDMFSILSKCGKQGAGSTKNWKPRTHKKETKVMFNREAFH